MKRRKTAYPLVFLTCLLSITLLVVPASASGPGEGGRRVRLNNEPAGPYLLRVVTSPTPPRVENFNVEVRVSDAETSEVLTDVMVWVTAIPTEFEGEQLRELATHDYAPIPTEYAAHIMVYEKGVWDVRVEVEGELGSGEASFLERISNPVSLGWLVAIGPPVVGLAILAFIFLRLQRGTQQSKDAES